MLDLKPRKGEEIGTLMHENESLKAQISDQFSQIRALNSGIKALRQLIHVFREYPVDGNRDL
jgi:hypothetical protein